jgi:hypothetical protein
MFEMREVACRTFGEFMCFFIPAFGFLIKSDMAALGKILTTFQFLKHLIHPDHSVINYCRRPKARFLITLDVTHNGHYPVV